RRGRRVDREIDGRAAAATPGDDAYALDLRPQREGGERVAQQEADQLRLHGGQRPGVDRHGPQRLRLVVHSPRVRRRPYGVMLTTTHLWRSRPRTRAITTMWVA